MKFKLYKNYGALNSLPVFQAFETGLKKMGHQVVDADEDIPVIWSVLWQGRMKSNQLIYEQAKRQNKPVLILEVGTLRRGVTWKISVDQVNGDGFFGNYENLDSSRPEKLNVSLRELNKNRRKEILIACQHESSLQWRGQPPMRDWVNEVISKINQFSDRKIIVRPHPRFKFLSPAGNIIFETPKKIEMSYDDFDISYDYHCIINHNSGPSIQAAISGVPVICGASSLAWPVSQLYENLESFVDTDRTQWFLQLCHTEYTLEEISQGLPLKRLESHLLKYKG